MIFQKRLLIESCWVQLPCANLGIISPENPIVSPWWLVAQLNASCRPLPGSLLPPCLFISAAWIAKITISSAGNLASREERETSGSQIRARYGICRSRCELRSVKCKVIQRSEEARDKKLPSRVSFKVSINTRLQWWWLFYKILFYFLISPNSHSLETFLKLVCLPFLCSI